MKESPPKSKGKIGERLNDFLWREKPERSWLGEWFLSQFRVFYFVFRGFIEHQCPLRASALTFVTLLSMVPLLALAFAMVKGLGLTTVFSNRPVAAHIARFSNQLKAVGTTETLVVSTPPPSGESPTTGTLRGEEKSFGELIRDALTAQLTADQKEIRDRIASYVERTNFSTLKAVGIIFLIIAAIAALGTMEDVFNRIWGVRRSRPILRKFADYLSVIIVCPLLVAAAMAMTATLSSNAVVERLRQIGILNQAMHRAFALGPYLSVWLALTLLYLFLPNTRVKLRAALAGGFVAGVVWQLAFRGYTGGMGLMSRYNAIYSTFAALPFFMSWLYVSWLIVLFGAEVAAAYQNIEIYARDHLGREISPAERLRIGLNLMLAVCARFRREQPPWTADQLSRYLGCPVAVVEDILEDLAHAGLVIASGNGQTPTYQPAIPLANISPARVIEALEETKAGGIVGNATPEALCARTLLEQWREGLWRELGQVGFDVLVDELQPEVSLPGAAQSARE